ncbi:MAG: DNA alkylation repair protein [Asgard group archaeon]|nr:DNA alkylation repair protein [Asgard group archaeon]
MELSQIISFLEDNTDQNSIEGMAKVGITPDKAYGIRIPVLSKLAKSIGKNHKLAVELWKIDTRETRILACMIENPKTVKKSQIDSWVKDFDYWEICDQCIMKLIEKTSFAHKKIHDWVNSNIEYVKRAGFVLAARLAVCDKQAKDDVFIKYLHLAIDGSTDNRKSVKLAVNWAIRQIGKRNKALNIEAIKIAEKILSIDSKSAQWIAKDALKELKSIKERD